MKLSRLLADRIYFTALTIRHHMPFWMRRQAYRTVCGGRPAISCREILAGLRQRAAGGPGPSFLFLPLQSWFDCGFQRFHQLAGSLATIGSPAFFYEPWGFRLGAGGSIGLSPDGVRQRQFVGWRDLGDRLHLLRVEPWLLMDCLAGETPDCLVMNWPDQAHFIPPNRKSLVLYDVLDDPSLMPGLPAWWFRLHQHWLRQADIVTATADRLLEQVHSIRPDAVLVPNGVQVDYWAIHSEVPVPEDLCEARRAPVVVIYYGALSDWFDWEMWLAAARARPDWSFVLLGFPFRSSPAAVHERLRGRKNIYYLGAKPHALLPQYMAHADVATIPFLLNDITHACSPVKLFEYMAAGKPIVATPMAEILKYRSVLFARDSEEFLARLDDALARRKDPDYLALLKAEAQANSWPTRAGRLQELVQQRLLRREPEPVVS